MATASPGGRRSVRLPAFDYAAAGAYFVTVWVRDRQCLFGSIAQDAMRLSPLGVLVHRCWSAIPAHFAHVELNAFVVMPNHLHGVLVFRATESEPSDARGLRRGMACHAPTTGHGAAQGDAMAPPESIMDPTRSAARRPFNPLRRFGAPPRGALSSVVGAFKSAVTRERNRELGTPGAPLWQRNYHEHVIRNDDDLRRIRRYIADNPLRWARDEENPGRMR